MDAALLLVAIELAEADSPQETNVTLIVDGLLISGFITSEDQYLTHLANAKHLKEQQKSSQASPECPNFIHLRDATYYQPGQKPNVDNIGSYTRVPFNAVIGFSFGNELR
jgi:hypothetical protein